MTDKLDWYRLEKGVVIGGPYNCAQAFPVEQIPADDPRVVDFYTRVEAARQEAMKPKPTVDDLVALLTAQQKAQLQDLMDAKGKL